MTALPGPPHILAVDDDETILDLFREVLGDDEGYRVSLRASAPAPAEVADLAPDLIVLDLLLGGDAGGLDLHAALRLDPRTREIPVVLCSAAHEHVRRLGADQLGAGVGLVLKPFDLDELLAEIQQGLRRRAERRVSAAPATTANGDGA